MSIALNIKPKANANNGEKTLLFCHPVFRRYAVGVGADGAMEIRLDKNKLGRNEVYEIKEFAQVACNEAKVEYNEAKFRSALADLEGRLGDKKAKIVEFGNRNPILAAIVSPVLDAVREHIDVAIMRIGDYFRAHELHSQ